MDQTEAELVREFRASAKDAVIEWARRWPDDAGNQFRVRYMEDGTAEIERETNVGFDRVSVVFDVVAGKADGGIPVRALQAVIDAARKWAHVSNPSEGEDAGEDLQDAVAELEKVLIKEGEKRSAGFILPRTWAQVVPGNWVRVPNGDWYEVISSKSAGAMQNVGLKAPDGKTGVFPRNPNQKVSVRVKTAYSPDARAYEALSAAFEDVTVIDAPPWDE